MKNVCLTLNNKGVRELFPALKQTINNRPLVYLDNAATTQKPQSVIDTITEYYVKYNSNVQRGAHTLASLVTEKFEKTRTKVANFINARKDDEIIFTKGATEALNLIAKTLCDQYLNTGDSVMISLMEHHSNLLPWRAECKARGGNLKVIPLTKGLALDIEKFKELLTPEVKILSITAASNVLGCTTPLAELIKLAHENGTLVCVDAAQYVQHSPVDVQELDCDFLVFSGHKMYGPMGVGVLYGKEELLKEFPVWQTGGSMAKNVTLDEVVYADLPHKYEAGTANVGGVIALGAAIDFLSNLGLDKIHQFETELSEYMLTEIQKVPSIHVLHCPGNCSNTISFFSESLHHYDIGLLLDNYGIAVRTGFHCAQPLITALNIPGTVRASLCMYNNAEDVDIFVATLGKLVAKYG